MSFTPTPIHIFMFCFIILCINKSRLFILPKLTDWIKSKKEFRFDKW